ncbi:hypothetical protein KIPB_015681, partial [Kipferlia bialata]
KIIMPFSPVATRFKPQDAELDLIKRMGAETARIAYEGAEPGEDFTQSAQFSKKSALDIKTVPANYPDKFD